MQSTPPPPTPIFVGRAAEIARLRAGFSRRARVALIYGVAGVGKSALAYVVAEDAKVVVHRRAGDEPLSVLADDLRRTLGGGAVPELTSDEERLADLATRADEREATLLIDDLHRLDPHARRDVVEALASSLRRGRAILTSRELVPRSAASSDRIEIQLGELSDDEARELWASLDELYGPVAGFERTREVARKNPFQLRRAHAGGLDDDDPIAAAVASLAPLELRLAAAMALAAFRIPSALLADLVEKEDQLRARQGLRALVTKLVVEVDAAGTCGLHDLFHDAVLAATPAAVQRELHEALATVVPKAGFDDVVRVRETTRHLVAIERFEEAGKVLVANGPALFRSGATAEVLRGVEAIPGERRSGEVQLLHARCLGRLFETSRAYRELTRLVESGAEPRYEMLVGLGEYALAIGELDVAHRALEPLTAADAGVPPAVRTQAVSMFALVLTQQGQGDRARRILGAEEERATDPTAAASFAFGQVFTLWTEERDAEADEPMRRARALIPAEKSPRFATGVLVPLTLACVLARTGRFEESAELVRYAETTAAKQEDHYTRVFVRRIQAAIALERGDRLGALSEMRAVADVYHRGRVIAAHAMDAWIGRVLLLLGRRVEAERILADAGRAAEEMGLANVIASIDRAREADVIVALRAPTRDVRPVGGDTRARAIAALRAAARGGAEETRRLFDANASDVDRPGYELDRALGHVALETLARLSGDARAAAEEHDRAARAASAGAVDDDLLDAVRAALGTLRLVTPTARPSAGAFPDLERFEIVVDGRTHEVRGNGRVVSLERRPALRRLVYTFASRPNAVVEKEALAKCLWPARYDALRHDNALWVNLRRLRVLLEPVGLRIDLTEDGYVLRVPERFLYVDPG